MMSPFVQFGQWQPDQKDFINSGLTVAENVVPDSGVYKPFPMLESSTNALASGPYGATSYIDVSGNTYIFVGTATKLYYLATALSWTDYTRATGGDYATGTEEKWNFVSYGDRLIATNYSDDIQTLLVGTDIKFSQLSSGAPRSKYMAIVNDFLVLANVYDSVDGAQTNRVHWSGIGDPTNFPAAGTSAAQEVQSGYKNIVGTGGRISGIVGSQNYGVVIQEKNIWRMEYVGAPYTFNFSLAEDKRGSKLPNSIISDGKFVYYIDEDGFYAFDGTSSQPIGVNKIDDYFNTDINRNYDYKLESAIDPIRHIIMWGYVSNSSSDGNIDKVICYSWTDQKFTVIKQSMKGLLSLLTRGYTLEELDSFGTMETLPYSLDSRVWQGGNFALAGFTSDNKLGYFSGDNLEAVIETGEFQVNENGRAFISGVLPITDAENIRCSIGTRNKQSDNVSYSAESTLNTQTGEANFRSENRYHRFKFRIPVSEVWGYAKGFKFDAKAQGKK
jgi:hypothetical protein